MTFITALIISKTRIKVVKTPNLSYAIYANTNETTVKNIPTADKGINKNEPIKQIKENTKRTQER